MGYLNKSKEDQEQQFKDLFEVTRKLFCDDNGDVTALWKRSIEIGKALYHVKNLSEAQCRKIYYDYKDNSHDKRYPPPKPWPLLRKNI